MLKNQKQKIIFTVVICVVSVLICAGTIFYIKCLRPNKAVVFDCNYLGSFSISDNQSNECLFSVGIHETNADSFGKQTVVLKIMNKKISSNETFLSEMYGYHKMIFSFILTDEQKNVLEQNLKQGKNPNFLIYGRNVIFDSSKNISLRDFNKRNEEAENEKYKISSFLKDNNGISLICLDIYEKKNNKKVFEADYICNENSFQGIKFLNSSNDFAVYLSENDNLVYRSYENNIWIKESE